ncbi:hypothetical protein J6590_056746 [Homalodisca vitripennis]|nr:hypothetical protein J6590_056746 [Homalodisca vitripennis]
MDVESEIGRQQLASELRVRLYRHIEYLFLANGNSWCKASDDVNCIIANQIFYCYIPVSKHLPPVTSVGSMSPPTQVYGCMRRRRPLNVSPRRGALRQFVLSRTGLDVYLSVSVSAISESRNENVDDILAEELHIRRGHVLVHGDLLHLGMPEGWHRQWGRPERCSFSDTSDTDGEDATWVDDAVWYDSLWMDDDHEQSLELSYCSQVTEVESGLKALTEGKG